MTNFIIHSQPNNVNQDKKFRLCGSYFRLKMVEAIRHNNGDHDQEL